MGTLYTPEKSSSDLKRVIDELIKGRDAAAQLQIQLQKPISKEDRGTSFVSAEELVAKILRSFTETIPALNSNICESGEVCQIPATSTGQVGSGSRSCCCDLRSVDSGESSKRPAAVKDRRGGYKRRKLTSDSRTNVSATMEDGFAWRKYGQKDILNANFPRCYFRCTHKTDQGCKAIKQVQSVQEEPRIYQTTYFGRHTCRVIPLHSTPQNMSNIAASDHDPPVLENNNSDHLLLSFESKIPVMQIPSSSKEKSYTTPTKKEEARSTDHDSENISSLDNSNIDWTDLIGAPFDVASYLHFDHESDHPYV